MKLKCYMRGLGIGMIITALILGFRSNATGGTMTDAEVIARARELGMVESGSLTLADVQSSAEGEEENVQEQMQNTENEADATVDQEPEVNQDTVTDTETATESEEESGRESYKDPSPSLPMEETEVLFSDTPVRFEIEPGSTSYTVSKILGNVGLVRDVKAFDTYLMENGYATGIQSGVYEILPGTSESDIAKIITGK